MYLVACGWISRRCINGWYVQVRYGGCGYLSGLHNCLGYLFHKTYTIKYNRACTWLAYVLFFRFFVTFDFKWWNVKKYKKAWSVNRQHKCIRLNAETVQERHTLRARSYTTTKQKHAHHRNKLKANYKREE